MSTAIGANGAPLEAGSSGPDGQSGTWWTRSGLVTRIAVSAISVALGLAIVFGFLFIAITGLRQRSLEARHSQQVIAAANRLQTLVIDLETGVRGFAITHGDESLLKPARDARRQYPGAIRTLVDLTKDNRLQHQRALSIERAIDRYFTDSLSIVEFLRRNPGTAPSVATSPAGRQQVESIRGQFANFLATERALGEERSNRARITARNALIVGGIGLGTALLLILLGAVYLNTAVAQAVRSAADAADRIAGGDFSGRLETDGPGEVGQLERTFNMMAASLERTLADLEERNRTLVESERAKSELVSNVSHELRTPLASVLGFSALMLDRDLSPAENRRYLEVIRAEARRLAELLNDLLDLQRVEQEALELRIEDIDLNDLLAAQVTLYSAQSDAHELRLERAETELVVRADRDRLAQVIGNLLSNAIKYSPEGGAIDVTAAQIGDEAWIWIRDQGLGIPAEDQERIFTKFFRGEVGRDHGISGTGLGLVLAQQIVEAHGGRLGFESTEGKGSTFWLQLPAVAARTGAGELAAARDDPETRHGI
jgi:signal transduction histidine kinase